MNIADVQASSQRKAVRLHDLTEFTSGRPIFGISVKWYACTAFGCWMTWKGARQSILSRLRPLDLFRATRSVAALWHCIDHGDTSGVGAGGITALDCWIARHSLINVIVTH